MSDAKMTAHPRPVMTWMPVRDERGRVRMEASWSVPTPRVAQRPAA